MRTLITNDDGIDSPGLIELARVAVEAGHEVSIAAPAYDCSGSSASLSALGEGGRLRLEHRTLPDLPDVPALAVHASPAMIVFAAARGAFGEAPELVLSGINRGPNVGQAVLHSGTVGAALTAASHGRPALAVSLGVIAAEAAVHERLGHVGAEDYRAPAGGPYWQTAARAAISVLSDMADGTDAVPGPCALNVNAPNVPVERLLGVRSAALAAYGAVQAQVGERGDDYVTLSFAAVDEEPQPDTDASLLAEGWATVTVLRTAEAGHQLIGQK